MHILVCGCDKLPMTMPPGACVVKSCEGALDSNKTVNLRLYKLQFMHIVPNGWASETNPMLCEYKTVVRKGVKIFGML